MEIHQALTRSNKIKNTLCRHEQVGCSCCIGAAHAARLLLAGRQHLRIFQGIWQLLNTALWLQSQLEAAYQPAAHHELVSSDSCLMLLACVSC